MDKKVLTSDDISDFMSPVTDMLKNMVTTDFKSGDGLQQMITMFTTCASKFKNKSYVGVFNTLSKLPNPDDNPVINEFSNTALVIHTMLISNDDIDEMIKTDEFKNQLLNCYKSYLKYRILQLSKSMDEIQNMYYNVDSGDVEFSVDEILDKIVNKKI